MRQSFSNYEWQWYEIFANKLRTLGLCVYIYDITALGRARVCVYAGDPWNPLYPPSPNHSVSYTVFNSSLSLHSSIYLLFFILLLIFLLHIRLIGFIIIIIANTHTHTHTQSCLNSLHTFRSSMCVYTYLYRLSLCAVRMWIYVCYNNVQWWVSSNENKRNKRLFVYFILRTLV